MLNYKQGLIEQFLGETNIIKYYNQISSSYWQKSDFDNKGNIIYHEYSNGYWLKSEYNEESNFFKKINVSFINDKNYEQK